MIKIRPLLLPLVVSGLTALAYAIIRRNRNLDTRHFDIDLSAWESEGGNLSPAEALVEPGSVITPDTNKGKL